MATGLGTVAKNQLPIKESPNYLLHDHDRMT